MIQVSTVETREDSTKGCECTRRTTGACSEASREAFSSLETKARVRGFGARDGEGHRGGEALQGTLLHDPQQGRPVYGALGPSN